MSGPRILCIEDEPGTADLLEEVLRDEGFDVVIASNAAEGLAALDGKPDLVLCDIDLPDRSGLELLASVRQSNLLSLSVPFIFVTAFSQRIHQVHARKLGCDDYVTKPIDFELLIAIIRHRLNNAASGRASPDEYALSERELEAMTWAARGKSSADIATILGISERTVNFHMDNVIRKVGVATRIQAAVKCVMLGLIKP
jgi:DNA-binding NarL/FixJ family response regulator